jgi:hypothetical protein
MPEYVIDVPFTPGRVCSREEVKRHSLLSVREGVEPLPGYTM